MINFYAPMNNLGYGIHSFNLLRALDEQGVDIALFPPNNNIGLNYPIIQKWIGNQKLFSSKDIGVMIFHEQFMNRFWGKKRIGFPVFETGLIPPDIEKLKTLDLILQTSEYYKNYLNSIGFNNVYVVPEGYDETIYNMKEFDLDKKMESLNRDGIIFSHVGKFEERKSSKDILKMFTCALDKHNTKCTLVAHMFNTFESDWIKSVTWYLYSLGYVIQEENNDSIKFVKNNLGIIILKRMVEDIRSVYNMSHFGLYASKAEGWGLPLIESIACGIPCITTNWTGMSEYLKDYPSDFIIDKGIETIAYDGKWFLGDKGNWITPDLSSLEKILRNIANEPEKYLRMSEYCYKSVENFTWTNSANIFREILDAERMI